MYQALSPSVIEDLEKQGEVVFTLKTMKDIPADQVNSPWRTIPHKISFQIGTEEEHIFNCWVQIYDGTMNVSHIETAGMLKTEERGLVDAYLYLTIKGAIDHARSIHLHRLVIDSYLSATAEHLADLGFELFPGGLPYRGSINL